MSCVLNEGETGVVVGDKITTPDGVQHVFADCDIRPGSTLSFPYVEDSMDPVTHPAPESPVAPVVTPESVPAAPAPEAAQTPAPAAPVTTAAVVQPDPTAQPLAGVQDLAKLGGDNPVAVIVLAGVAVLGGGAAWKFYNQKSSQTHELKMKEMELKSQTPSQSPPPCIMKHGELDTKLAAIEAKLSKLEHKTASFSAGGPSSDELDERVIKLEKTVKSLAAKKAGAK